jgi:hypothetical protein
VQMVPVSRRGITVTAGRVSTGPCCSSRPGTGSRRSRPRAQAERASSGRSGSSRRDTESRRRRCWALVETASSSRNGNFHQGTVSRSCTRPDRPWHSSTALGCRLRSRRAPRPPHRTGGVSSRTAPRKTLRESGSYLVAIRRAGSDQRTRSAARGRGGSSGSAASANGSQGKGPERGRSSGRPRDDLGTHTRSRFGRQR